MIFNGTAVFELVNHRATDTEDAACATGPDRRYWEARYNADRRWGGDSSLPIPPYPAFEDNVVEEGKAAEQSREQALQEEDKDQEHEAEEVPVVDDYEEAGMWEGGEAADEKIAAAAAAATLAGGDEDDAFDDDF